MKTILIGGVEYQLRIPSQGEFDHFVDRGQQDVAGQAAFVNSLLDKRIPEHKHVVVKKVLTILRDMTGASVDSEDDGSGVVVSIGEHKLRFRYATAQEYDAYVKDVGKQISRASLTVTKACLLSHTGEQFDSIASDFVGLKYGCAVALISAAGAVEEVIEKK